MGWVGGKMWPLCHTAIICSQRLLKTFARQIVLTLPKPQYHCPSEAALGSDLFLSDAYTAFLISWT